MSNDIFAEMEKMLVLAARRHVCNCLIESNVGGNDCMCSIESAI